MKNPSQPTLWKIALLFLAQWVAAGVAATLGILVYTRDFETIGLGLLSSILLFGPSAVSFGMHVWKRRRGLTLAGYLVPLLGLLLWLGIGWWYASQQKVSDGSDQWIQVALVTIVAGGAGGFAALLKLMLAGPTETKN